VASQPKYPVYIISKGRWEKPLTAKHFEMAGIPYLIAVEPSEYDNYCKSLGKNRVLKLPFSNLGLGSYPARNYCWEHSMQMGHKKHFIFDDNIRGFCKWVNSKKKQYDDISQALQYVASYSDTHDVDICGYEYRYMCMKPPKAPFKSNVHVYSAMLIKNDLPYRWRLKYNEDVDLCLQVLHNGGSTASCVYYLTNKVSTTAKMKGGNQDELYKGNDPAKKLLKAKMLEAVWPQYAKTVIRFNRIHHFVDWKVFSRKVSKKQ
jgi:hypothetical protein